MTIEFFQKPGRVRYSIVEGMPYPVTVTSARYGGLYEGGRFIAWPEWPENIPAEAHGDNLTCSTFFDAHVAPLGKGSAPGDAILDLARNIRKLPKWDPPGKGTSDSTAGGLLPGVPRPRSPSRDGGGDVEDLGDEQEEGQGGP
jgi:hypothetical protein